MGPATTSDECSGPGAGADRSRAARPVDPRRQEGPGRRGRLRVALRARLAAPVGAGGRRVDGGPGRAARVVLAVRRRADRRVPHRLPARAAAWLRGGRPQPGLPPGTRDRPQAGAVAGVLAVVVGILLISLGGPRTRGSARAGVFWGVGTGVAIAAYTLWDNHAVNALDIPPLPYFVLGLALQLPAMTLLLGRRRRLLPSVWREARGPVIAVAVLSPMAYVLVLRAMQLAPVSLVAPARESSIVVGALLSWWLLKEPSAVRRLLGAAIVLVGIVGIVAG